MVVPRFRPGDGGYNVTRLGMAVSRAQGCWCQELRAGDGGVKGSRFSADTFLLYPLLNI